MKKGKYDVIDNSKYCEKHNCMYSGSCPYCRVSTKTTKTTTIQQDLLYIEEKNRELSKEILGLHNEILKLKIEQHKDILNIYNILIGMKKTRTEDIKRTNEILSKIYKIINKK